MAVAPPLLQPGSPIPVGWRQFVSRAGTTGDASFSWLAPSQAVEVMDVAYDDTYEFIRHVLGWSQQLPDKSMRRQPPVRHPRWDHLRATRIASVRGVQWVAKQPGLRGPTSRYALDRYTVTFEALPFPILDDNELVFRFGTKDESKRYVFVERSTSAEFLTRDRGAFEWAETGTGGPTVGQDVPAPVSQLLSKEGLRITWYWVPEPYLFDANGIPVRLQACEGRVNQAAFLGRTAQTVLMLPSKVMPVPAPVAPQVIGLLDFQPSRLWNVEMYFSVFDPPTNGTTKGWNTAPFAGNGNWYKIASKDGMKAPFETADFGVLFQPVP